MDYNGDKSTAHTTNTHLTCKAAGCSFFGTAQTEGYCSVCYKAIIAKKNAQPASVYNSAPTTPQPQPSKEEEDKNNTIINPEDDTNDTMKNEMEIQSSSKQVISSNIDETICSTVKNKSVSSASDSIEKSTTSITTNEAPKLDNKTPNHQNNQITPQIPSSTSSSTTTPIPVATPSSTTISTPISETETTKSDTPKKAKKRRCGVCKKKIGLTGFECRCGGLFCSIHRYADVHNCSFDYKVDGREKIRKANPVVQDDKINRF